MDNKRLLIAMLIGVALMAGWFGTLKLLDRRHPEWHLLSPPKKSEPAPTFPTPAPAVTASTSSPTTSPAANSQLSAATGPSALALTRAENKTLTLGSVLPDNPDFTLGVELTSRGAGVQSVTLNRFKQHVEKPDRYVFQTPATSPGATDDSRVLASRSITLDGIVFNLAALEFHLVSSDTASATFQADIRRGNATAFRVTKIYRLTGAKDPTQGYEILVELKLENLSPAPVTASTVLNGSNTPPWEIERGPERQFVQGYLNTTSKQVSVRQKPIEQFTPEKPVLDLTHDADSVAPIAWFGSTAAYFNAVVRPLPLDKSTDYPQYVAKVEAACFNPNQKDGHLRDAVTFLTTTNFSLAPGTSITLPFHVYFGPKQRAILQLPYYSAYPLEYDQTLVITSWLCSFCTFQWLIGVLVWMLNAFHAVVRDWGIAIIVLVVIVRTLLHPITRKSQENMAKMQKMSPALAKLKEKFKDDKEGLQRATMDFYKEQGTTPIMGCLPMFLQMPIWLALYAGLQSTFELRHQPFFYGLTWIHDLAQPDHLFTFTPIKFALPLCGDLTFSGINIIPFLLAIVFWFQYKLTPKPPASTPEQEQQQKMMQWMTLLMPVFLYSAPSGLNIYILTSTSFGILENKLIRDRIKRQEAATAQGAVTIIDNQTNTEISAHSRKTPKPAAATAPKKSGLMGALEKLQNMAEEVRRQQERKK